MRVDGKKIIMYLILAIIAVLFVFAVNYSKEKEKTPKDENGQIIVEQVTERKDFFTVCNNVNNFYEYIEKKDYHSAFNILATKYKKNITEKDLKILYPYSYDNITYHCKNIYYRNYGTESYYFIKGEIHGYNLSTQILDEIENVYVLLILDRSNQAFSIIPLESITDLNDYAKTYKISSDSNITLNDNNKYIQSSFSDEYVFNYYINYFSNILYLNKEKAYNMLSEKYKKSFNGYNNFKNKIPVIDEELTTTHRRYNLNKENSINIYTIVTYNLKEIVITETSPMNFKIEINDLII